MIKYRWNGSVSFPLNMFPLNIVGPGDDSFSKLVEGNLFELGQICVYMGLK